MEIKFSSSATTSANAALSGNILVWFEDTDAEQPHGGKGTSMVSETWRLFKMFLLVSLFQGMY